MTSRSDDYAADMAQEFEFTDEVVAWKRERASRQTIGRDCCRYCFTSHPYDTECPEDSGEDYE